MLSQPWWGSGAVVSVFHYAHKWAVGCFVQSLILSNQDSIWSASVLSTSTVPCRMILAQESWCGYTKPVSVAWPWQGVVPACQRSWWLVVWQTHSSCALCIECTADFCSMYARIPGFFSPDWLCGSYFCIHITGWRLLGTWTVSTLLVSWCTPGSCSSLSLVIVLFLPPLLSCHPLLRWKSWHQGTWSCPLLQACWVWLFTMTLLFSELTSILYASAVLSNLVVRSSSSASLPPMTGHEVIVIYKM